MVNDIVAVIIPHPILQLPLDSSSTLTMLKLMSLSTQLLEIKFMYPFSFVLITALARILNTLYRWNFVMLRGLEGPRSQSFWYGHVDQIHLDECSSVWYNWESVFGHALCIRGFCTEPILVLTDPKAISHVLNHDAEFPRADTNKNVLKNAFGRSLFIAEGLFSR